MKKSVHIPPEIIRKIKEIQIYTRRLLSGSLVGDTRSALKGTGFEFDQIREYQMGDDIRFIDWNASARNNTLLIKQYIEERSRTIFLAVDISGSSEYGPTGMYKRKNMIQLASVLALVSDYGKDRVGLVLFSDHIECYIPPAQGHRHVHRIIERMFMHKAQSQKTSITSVLRHLAKLKKRDAMVFLISDFIDHGYEKDLAAVSKKYDLVAVRCLDTLEQELPNVGFVPIKDIESGKTFTLDTSQRNTLHNFLAKRVELQSKVFKKNGIDVLDLSSKGMSISDIVLFFRRRMRY